MVQIETARARAMADTRNRILDVALDVLGRNPDAGMGDIAAAAGVVRRTVYGHFPTRTDLVRTLAQRAVNEIEAVLVEVGGASPGASSDAPADAVWTAFVARLWPLAHRYRVLLALRRGEYGDEIHALLGTVDEILAALVRRGQRDGVFGRHLPAGILGQLAYATVFSIADADLAAAPAADADPAPADTALADEALGRNGLRAATLTSLLLLGVPEPRAESLAASDA